MGQKTNPIGNRLGIIKGWDSNWYGGNDYKAKLIEDFHIRRYIPNAVIKVDKSGGNRAGFGRKDEVTLKTAGISKIIIERTLKLITITIHVARPGIIIGSKGEVVDMLKNHLKKITGKEVQINIAEVKRPELDAVLVANNIAKQIEGRISFRRAIKTSIASTMRIGAEGIKVLISGRIGGAEMARSEQYKEGRTPLHTLRADIDYAMAEAHTTYGRIGIKVWICKGEIFGKKDLSPDVGTAATPGKPQSPRFRSPRKRN